MKAMEKLRATPGPVYDVGGHVQYVWIAADAGGTCGNCIPASGQHSGSRWGWPAACCLTTALSIHQEGLRRCGIPGSSCGQCHIHRHRDHPPPARPGRIRCAARTMAVECFFAWINRNRRLWKDTEATIASAAAFLDAASAMTSFDASQGHYEFRGRL